MDHCEQKMCLSIWRLQWISIIHITLLIQQRQDRGTRYRMNKASRGHAFVVPPSLATFTSSSRILSVSSTLDRNCQNSQQKDNNTRDSRYDHSRFSRIPIIRSIGTSLIHTTNPAILGIDIINTQPKHWRIVKVRLSRYPVMHGSNHISILECCTRDAKARIFVTGFVALVVAILCVADAELVGRIIATADEAVLVCAVYHLPEPIVT